MRPKWEQLSHNWYSTGRGDLEALILSAYACTFSQHANPAWEYYAFQALNMPLTNRHERSDENRSRIALNKCPPIMQDALFYPKYWKLLIAHYFRNTYVVYGRLTSVPRYKCSPGGPASSDLVLLSPFFHANTQITLHLPSRAKTPPRLHHPEGWVQHSLSCSPQWGRGWRRWGLTHKPLLKLILAPGCLHKVTLKYESKISKCKQMYAFFFFFTIPFSQCLRLNGVMGRVKTFYTFCIMVHTCAGLGVCACVRFQTSSNLSG